MLRPRASGACVLKGCSDAFGPRCMEIQMAAVLLWWKKLFLKTSVQRFHLMVLILVLDKMILFLLGSVVTVAMTLQTDLVLNLDPSELFKSSLELLEVPDLKEAQESELAVARDAVVAL